LLTHQSHAKMQDQDAFDLCFMRIVDVVDSYRPSACCAQCISSRRVAVKTPLCQWPRHGDVADWDVFRMNIFGAAGIGKFVLDTIKEGLAQFPVALHTGVDFKAIEVCGRELKDNKLCERGDLLVFHLTREWSWDIEFSVVLKKS
jgi:hypothetical protein